MRAIVLAAGMGTRLKPLTDDCPKCLVTLNGKAMIDYQLDALDSVGIDDVIVVIGAKAEQVRAHCNKRVRYIENQEFSSTNSIYSLFLASKELHDELFLVNCDILFDPNILKKMLKEPQGNVLAVDTKKLRIPNEMNVCFDSTGRISKISKNIDPDDAQAQSVQLIKFDMFGAQLLKEEVARIIRANKTETFPTEAYGPIIKSSGIFKTDVGDCAWGEIDDIDDYNYAVKHIIPALV